MTTATEFHDAAQKERDARILELRMEKFCKDWAPDDRYEASRFHSELLSIVRQIYAEAQAPLLKYLNAVVAAMPLFPPPKS
jgi:hypothetical protein